MYSILYLVIYIIVFFVIYVAVNSLTTRLFNKGKSTFKLKEKTKFRLANNYTYGDRLDGEHDGNLNCSLDGNLIECDIDENNDLGRDAKCMQCKQISSRCINIKEPIYDAADPSVVLIKPNETIDKGYCLPTITTAQTCTRKNGGKWILTHTSTENDEKYLIYTFECYCSTPNFFQNNIGDINNDCTQFVGCRNGRLENDIWSSYEDMRCICPSNLYEEKLGNANTPPTCIPLNIYRRTYDNGISPPFDIIDKQYIDKDYQKIIGSGFDKLNLPNSCTFDVTTKTYIHGIGRVIWNIDRTIAYCESTNSNYKSVIINDDYLQGNGGKYANAMMRYRVRDTLETNDDASDHYNNYDSGTMYEVLRKGMKHENISGIRIPYFNFPIYLPYLESSSFNMGNPVGRHYTLHPIIPGNRRNYTFVYVFDVNIPDYKIKINFGDGIQYIPAFMSINYDSGYRVYNGAIPCVNVARISRYYNKRAFWIMYPTPPGKQYQNKLGKTGIMDSQYHINVESDKLTAGYGFHFEYDGKIEPYTLLFTGSIFTYALNGKIYTRPVSCGDIVLTQKYRQNLDTNWTNRPQEAIVGVNSQAPFQFAVTDRDTHMFTRNSYDMERHEIGVTGRAISRYDLNETEGNLNFKRFYS